MPNELLLILSLILIYACVVLFTVFWENPVCTAGQCLRQLPPISKC